MTRSSFKKPAASPHNANSTTPDLSTSKRRRVQEVLPDAEEVRGEGCTTTDNEDYTQTVVDEDLQGMQVPLTALLSILSTHHLKGEVSSKKVKRKVKKLEETVDDLRDRYAYLHRKLAALPQQVDPPVHLPPTFSGLEPTGNLRERFDSLRESLEKMFPQGDEAEDPNQIWSIKEWAFARMVTIIKLVESREHHI